MNNYRGISIFFLIIVLIELCFTGMCYLEIVDHQLTNNDYIESVISIVLGIFVAYGLGFAKIWGFVLAIIVIPSMSVYSFIDALKTNENDLNLIYGGMVFGIFGFIVLTIIKNSPSIYTSYNWVKAMNKQLLILPRLMFFVAIYLLASYFMDNFIALFLAAIVLISIQMKPKTI